MAKPVSVWHFLQLRALQVEPQMAQVTLDPFINGLISWARWDHSTTESSVLHLQSEEVPAFAFWPPGLVSFPAPLPSLPWAFSFSSVFLSISRSKYSSLVMTQAGNGMRHLTFSFLSRAGLMRMLARLSGITPAATRSFWWATLLILQVGQGVWVMVDVSVGLVLGWVAAGLDGVLNSVASLPSTDGSTHTT